MRDNRRHYNNGRDEVMNRDQVIDVYPNTRKLRQHGLAYAKVPVMVLLAFIAIEMLLCSGTKVVSSSLYYSVLFVNSVAAGLFFLVMLYLSSGGHLSNIGSSRMPTVSVIFPVLLASWLNLSFLGAAGVIVFGVIAFLAIGIFTVIAAIFSAQYMTTGKEGPEIDWVKYCLMLMVSNMVVGLLATEFLTRWTQVFQVLG
jgi:hypothetical protein